MFKWLQKSRVAGLNREYAKLLVEARDLQRKGDIVAFAGKTAEAEDLLRQIDELKAAENS